MNRPFRPVRLAEPPQDAPSAPLPEEALLQPPADALVRLYYAIESMRADGQPRVLQFIAATAGEGTSTIAGALARIAAANRGQAVLLLHCGDADQDKGGVHSVIDAFRAGLPLAQAASRPCQQARYRQARLADFPRQLLDLPPAACRELFQSLRRDFDLTLLDSPAAGDAPEAAALARHCDGTILVVQAEATRIDAVERARRDIERLGGQVVGAVLNRQRRHIPGWLERWC